MERIISKETAVQSPPYCTQWDGSVFVGSKKSVMVDCKCEQLPSQETWTAQVKGSKSRLNFG